jgi:hypothetical protein
LWINSTKEGIVNYKGDFSFSLESLEWAYSMYEGIVNYNSLKCNSTPSFTLPE